MTIRVVLDTNIFISGIFWEGNYCSQIIDAWRSGKIMLVSSLGLVQEFVETIRDFKIKMPEEVIREWHRMIIENSVMVVPTEKLNIIKDDPKDNKFFEAAVAGKSQYIVSQDKKHILNIPEFKGIRTIHPERFVELIS
ncbi:MAG TPA: putative toxin-antitoxin system toxin component, PIN family [Candidatus Nanoarchaeia archaeon]|nr:putative toxin-antitoxin system toxin component, PIN family [Candidatus Nanoarchaeia archaeon]